MVKRDVLLVTRHDGSESRRGRRRRHLLDGGQTLVGNLQQDAGRVQQVATSQVVAGILLSAERVHH